MKQKLFRQVIDYLNSKAGKRYKYTDNHKKFIQARVNEGFELEDFQVVVDNMIIMWGRDEKMERYLRPSTLFSNKMDGYLNLNVDIKEKTDIENFSEKANDWIKERNGDDNGSGISKGGGDSQDSRIPGAGERGNGSLVSKSAESTNPRLPDGRTPYSEDGTQD